MKIGETSLDTNEEWLVRNALSCYRETISKLPAAERAEGEANPAYAEACERIALSWGLTVARVDALLEKLG